jgi:hypothetical protein
VTETNPVEVISEKGSPAHTELVGILHQLATRGTRGNNGEMTW